jgi:hypothetical protein
MRPSEALELNRQAVREIALSHRVSNVRVFGSVVHGDDQDSSDLDLLVTPTQETTLFDLARIKGRIEALLGVPVDVLTPNSLPDKFRAAVLAEARAV